MAHVIATCMLTLCGCVARKKIPKCVLITIFQPLLLLVNSFMAFTEETLTEGIKHAQKDDSLKNCHIIHVHMTDIRFCLLGT